MYYVYVHVCVYVFSTHIAGKKLMTTFSVYLPNAAFPVEYVFPEVYLARMDPLSLWSGACTKYSYWLQLEHSHGQKNVAPQEMKGK